MKRIIPAFFALLILTLNHAAQSETINWQTDYKEALALSRETGKPLLIDFWAKWCQPCQVMDEQFWTRADVIKAAKSFVPLKIDYDAQRPLAKHFIVRGLPYIAFSDPFGNLITFRKGFGAFNAVDLNQIAGEMPKDFAVLNKAFKAAELKKDDSVALLEIADYYSKNKMAVASGRYYKLAYDTPEIQRDAVRKEAVAAKIGQQFYVAGSFYQAAYAFEDYLKLFQKGASKESIYATLTRVYVYLGKLNEAQRNLEKLKSEFPASKWISDAAGNLKGASREK